MKRTLLLNVLLICGLILAGCGGGGGGTADTGIISGVISDAADSAALNGATVTTDPATSTATTNSSGNYTITNVTPGDYIVTAAINGYAAISAKVTVTANATATKNIKLVNKTSMVAWYNFNGNTNDSSGNNKHATSISGAFLTTDFLGRINHSYSFDGIDDYIAIPNLWGAGNLGVTISAWINTAVLNNAEHVVLYQGDNMGTGTYLGVGDSNGVYLSVAYTDGSSSGIGSMNSLTTDTWTHIAGTWEKGATDGIFRVYINGVQDNVGLGINTMFLESAASVDPNAIGALARANHYFNGKITDIRVYVRALSAAEIAALAQQ